jgi:hypothetical protein
LRSQEEGEIFVRIFLTFEDAVESALRRNVLRENALWKSALRKSVLRRVVLRKNVFLTFRRRDDDVLSDMKKNETSRD